MSQLYQEELAQLYDAAVPDWPGEIAFYRRLAGKTEPDHESVLEVACGTGRVAVQLARAGIQITGIDLSHEMLDIARNKSADLPNIRWIQADMRTFDLQEQYGLAIVPAFSFQLLLTENDQTSCLKQVASHLKPGARLVLHLEHHDPDWLATLPLDDFTAFAPSGETLHPITGQHIRVSYAWSYVPATQSISVIIRYETIEKSGRVIATKDRDPLEMHCTSPHNLQQLLAQSGFETEVIYSDFTRHPFQTDSEEMIWVARKE